jgi:hypothetical protein
MVRKLLLGLVLAWAAFGFASEAWRAQRSRGRPGRAEAILWRFPSLPVAQLGRCLAGVHPRVPAGSRVLFVARAMSAADAQYRWRWAAYFLPEMDVLPAGDPATEALAEYVVAYRRGYEAPRARALAELEGCTLYRVEAP